MEGFLKTAGYRWLGPVAGSFVMAAGQHVLARLDSRGLSRGVKKPNTVLVNRPQRVLLLWVTGRCSGKLSVCRPGKPASPFWWQFHYSDGGGDFPGF